MSNTEEAKVVNAEVIEESEVKVDKKKSFISKAKDKIREHKNTIIKVAGGFVAGTLATIGVVKLSNKKCDDDYYDADYGYEDDFENYLEEPSDIETSEVTEEVKA